MIEDFLKTKRDKKDLKIALEVIREFKSHESREEWLAYPILTWVKLEKLEGYLEELLNDADNCKS